MKNRAILFAFGVAIVCMGFSGIKNNSSLRDKLRQSGHAQHEQINNDPGLEKMSVSFAALLQQREWSSFYRRLDTTNAQCLWLIETFDLRDLSYSATELHFNDAGSSYSFHDRTGTDTMDHDQVYMIYHVPLKGRLSSFNLDGAFSKVSAPFKVIGNKDCWHYPDTVSLVNYYAAGTRKPSRKKQNAWREKIRSDIANTIVLYTMIGPEGARTSVQLPPAAMPYIRLRIGRITVCF